MQTATDITARDALPARLPRGLQLGDHVVDGWLRDGGMAAIYRAHRVCDGRRVALKLQLPSTAHDAVIGARFDREAELMRRVGGSPHVVELFDAGVLEDGRRYLVMEWVDGEDLEELLDFLRNQDQRLPIPRACRIARDVARGLVALHEHGVVHLDLKPANVMVGREADGSDVIKLVDFGIAEDLRAPVARPLGPAVAGVMGTSSYMCPQQTHGQPPEPSFDVYALGVLLFEALTGSRVPPDGWTPETLPRVETRRRGVPRAVAELVRACMDFEAGRRPAKAATVADALGTVLADVDAGVMPSRSSSSEEIPVRSGGTEVVHRSKVTSSGHWMPARTGGTEVSRTHQEVLSSSGIGGVGGPLTREMVAETMRRLEETKAAASVRRRARVRWGVAAVVVAVLGVGVWVGVGGEDRAEAAAERMVESEPANGPAMVESERRGHEVAGGAGDTKDDGVAARAVGEGPESGADVPVEPELAVAPQPAPPSRNKPSKAAGPSKETCRAVRTEASEANKNRQWKKVLQATSQRGCWTGQAVERARLRVAAFAELGDFGACVKEGARSRDRDTERRTAFCRKRLDENGRTR
jgi:serine/threonine protein kinase